MKELKTNLINLLVKKKKKLERYVLVLNIIVIVISLLTLILSKMNKDLRYIVCGVTILLIYFNLFFNTIKREKISTLKRNKLVSFLLANEDFHFVNLFFIELIILIISVDANFIIDNLSFGFAIFVLYLAIVIVDLKLSKDVARYFKKKIIK